MFKATVIGNLGRDPDVRPLQSGKKVASFSVASTEKTGNGQETIWINCEAWEKTAEVAEKYLRKGSQVYIEGRMKLEKWTDKEGRERETYKLVIADMRLIGGKPDNATEQKTAQTATTVGKPDLTDSDDDLPF